MRAQVLQRINQLQYSHLSSGKKSKRDQNYSALVLSTTATTTTTTTTTTKKQQQQQQQQQLVGFALFRIC